MEVDPCSSSGEVLRKEDELVHALRSCQQLTLVTSEAQILSSLQTLFFVYVVDYMFKFYVTVDNKI